VLAVTAPRKNNPTTINPANTTVNGLGSLIVGYNELGNTLGDARTGPHNVVLGQTNSHTTFGGLLAGRNNTISGVFASVSGGEKNNAKAGSDRSAAGLPAQRTARMTGWPGRFSRTSKHRRHRD